MWFTLITLCRLRTVAGLVSAGFARRCLIPHPLDSFGSNDEPDDRLQDQHTVTNPHLTLGEYHLFEEHRVFDVLLEVDGFEVDRVLRLEIVGPLYGVDGRQHGRSLFVELRTVEDEVARRLPNILVELLSVGHVSVVVVSPEFGDFECFAVTAAPSAGRSVIAPRAFPFVVVAQPHIQREVVGVEHHADVGLDVVEVHELFFVVPEIRHFPRELMRCGRLWVVVFLAPIFDPFFRRLPLDQSLCLTLCRRQPDVLRRVQRWATSAGFSSQRHETCSHFRESVGFVVVSAGGVTPVPSEIEEIGREWVAMELVAWIVRSLVGGDECIVFAAAPMVQFVDAILGVADDHDLRHSAPF